MSPKAKPVPTTIPEWLLLGPIPISKSHPGEWLRHGYPCEEDFAPEPKERFDGLAWRPWQADENGFVALHDPRFCGERREWAVAYAAAYVYTGRSQKLHLNLGSDDGIAVWLNGEELHRIDVQRGLVADEDTVPLSLRKGWNVLLLEISQGVAAWTFQARLTPARGSGEVKGVRFSLRRPRGPAFRRLAKRRNGLVPREPAPRLSYVTKRGSEGFVVSLKVFNDHGKSSGPVKLRLTGSDPKTVVEGTSSSVRAFASGDVSLRIPPAKAVGVFAGGRRAPVLAIVDGNTENRVKMDGEAGPRAFLSIMGGFPVALAAPGGKNGVFHVPSLFRGQPALVEIYAPNPQALSREVSWPEFESELIPGKQTKKGRIPIRVRPPRGVPALACRILFGSTSFRAAVDELEFLVQAANPDLTPFRGISGEGLAAVAEGDFRGAARALRKLHRELKESLPNRKNETVSLVGHAHIDMNWLWTQQETVQLCQDTFRQVLRFMDEFPEFCFSQSQASTYEAIENFDPELFKQIRKRVKEGRWELLGGAVDEGDTNMSSGEGICRTFLLGQGYFRDRFGKISRVGWLPDNFGHVAQLPQLLRLAGMGFFYGHRCQPKQGPYVWEGADGSRVLNFATPTYNGEVTPEIMHAPTVYNPKDKKAIWVFGVGDHGGGPTRRDMTRTKAYDELPNFPKMEFTTAEKFYRSLKPRLDDYPVYKGELQYIFEGCYTSISRIKEGNRRAENTLYTGELLSALRSLGGDPYPKEVIRRAWYTVTFNQFHDILCGSATHESNRESIGNYDRANGDADQVVFEGMRRLAEDVTTTLPGGAEKDGAQPVVIFNPLPHKRTDVVEAEIFSHQPPPGARVPHWGYFIPQPLEAVDVGQGPYPSIKVLDHEGNEIPAQITNGKLYPNGYRLKIRFTARDLPAGGFRTYFAYPAEVGAGAGKEIKIRGTRIETPHLIVEVDPKNGHLTRVYDRKRKQEVIARGEAANLLKIFMEAPHGMSAWNLGPVTEVHTLDKADEVRVVEEGPVRAAIQVKRKWNRSEFIQRIYVYRDLARVDFELDARWFELGGPDKDSPTLRVSFPLGVKKGKFVCDTPFAAVERPTNGQEVPAQKWIDLADRGGGAALLNDSKYGHRCIDNRLETTLLRASYDPDLYPEQGPHTIRYSLVPHRGSWIQGGIAQAGVEFNAPIEAMETKAHNGPLPVEGSLFEISPGNVYLSAIKQPERGKGLVVRLYEGHGKPGGTDTVLTLPKAVKSVERVNILEDRIRDRDLPKASARGRKVRIKLHPHEVVTLRIKL